MVAPILAAKGAQNAANALTGDIYVKRWTSVHGKGKKKKEVDHELHINPLTALAAAALGAGALATAAVGLWLTQQKVGKKMSGDTVLPKLKVRYARLYEGVYETITTVVVDSPAHEETYTTYIHGFPKGVTRWVQAVTHEEYKQIVKKAPRCVLYTDRFIPLKTVAGIELVDKIPWFSEHEAAKGWTFSESASFSKTGEDTLGSYSQYKIVLKNENKASYGITQRTGLFE